MRDLLRDILIHLYTHSTNIFTAQFINKFFCYIYVPGNNSLHNSLYLILHLIFNKLSSSLLSYGIPHSIINISASTKSGRHYDRSKQKASQVPAIRDLTVHTERWVSDQLIHQRRKREQKYTGHYNGRNLTLAQMFTEVQKKTKKK